MSRTARIDIRTDAGRKKIIVRAAELTGVERIVAEREGVKILLTAEHWVDFCKRLDEAPKDLPGMRELLARPSRFVEADEH